MIDEIRKLLQDVIVQDLKNRKGGQITQEDRDKLNSKKKSLLSELIAADKNDIEREKVENDRRRNDNESRKIDIEEKRLEMEAEIEREKLRLEELKIENEKKRIEADKEMTENKNKWDFLGKAVTGALTLAGTVVGLLFLNKWTQWGFIQEEFGSITGKTMNNVMREWKVKRL